MKLKNNSNYSVDHDPTGTLVQMVEELCTDTGLNREQVLSQFPDFISGPVRERLASEKRTHENTPQR